MRTGFVFWLIAFGHAACRRNGHGSLYVGDDFSQTDLESAL
jgi:uncharacterized protein with PIN domain